MGDGDGVSLLCRPGRNDETEPNDVFTECENLNEFFATAAPRLTTSVGESLFEQVKTRYERELGRDYTR